MTRGSFGEKGKKYDGATQLQLQYTMQQQDSAL